MTNYRRNTATGEVTSPEGEVFMPAESDPHYPAYLAYLQAGGTVDDFYAPPPPPPLAAEWDARRLTLDEIANAYNLALQAGDLAVWLQQLQDAGYITPVAA